MRVLFVVLALQLAFGLEVDVAYAAVPVGMQAMAAQTTSMHASDDACPLHNASSTDASHAAKAPDTNAPPDTGKHDCCKSSCQCQCGSLSLAFNWSVTRDIPVTAYVQPVRVSHLAQAPADTHFRPPIA